MIPPPGAALGATSEIELNRRGLLAPSQSPYVAPSLGDLRELAPILALFPIGLLVLALLVAFSVDVVIGFVAVGVLGPLAAVATAFLLAQAKRAKAAPPPPPKQVRAVDGFVAWLVKGWQAFEQTAQGPRPLGEVCAPPGPYRFYLFGTMLVAGESRLGPGWFSIGDNKMEVRFDSSRGESTAGPIPIGDRQAYARALELAVGFGPENIEAHRRLAQSAGAGSGPVAIYEGIVQARWFSQGGRGLFVSKFLVCGPLDLAVTDQVARVVVPGLVYRVYYDPARGRLLALEAL